MSKLTVRLESKDQYILNEHYVGCDFKLVKEDTSDLNIHDWFSIFEKVLRYEGFTETIIMKGGVQLAFNEWRDSKKMQEVYNEYALDDFAPKPETPTTQPDLL